MIRKLLIANRGEIACRIIRTCRAMGISTVAVYSDADAEALHVTLADEAVYLGASPASESYLNGEKIIQAAQRTQANAIHPGYGFLAENAAFAHAVIMAGLIFVGPSPKAIEAMGDKRRAKLLLQDVPFVPGYIGDDQSDEALIRAAESIGYPIMVKATAGGGGKGMRQVSSSIQLPEALAAARREAKQAFGDDSLMIEKAILQPRHIEVQIFGDDFGKVIALGERECSIQRRHQKIVEETPSVALSSDLRQRMFEVAVSVGTQIGYSSAGTVEFLLDADGQFYFMEMNTRLQVEHPVTEAVYEIDLVRWQIEVAGGASLEQLIPPFAMDADTFAFESFGHAIEVRVYAEDPANQFLPVIGEIVHWEAPSGVRVDAGIRSGDSISTYYDPMIAKIIAYGETRSEAIHKLDYALGKTQLLGLRNNIAFLRRVLMHPLHVAGEISTRFLDENPHLMTDPERDPTDALIVAALVYSRPSANTTHWRNNSHRAIRHRFIIGASEHEIYLNPKREGEASVMLGDATHSITYRWHNDMHLTLTVNGHRQDATAILSAKDELWIHLGGEIYTLRWQDPLPLPDQMREGEGSLRAPMPGQIIQVLVTAGQSVAKGDLLLIMEAMKMEHRIEAPYAGIIETLHYQLGDTVQADAVLLALKPA